MLPPSPPKPPAESAKCTAELQAACASEKSTATVCATCAINHAANLTYCNSRWSWRGCPIARCRRRLRRSHRLTPCSARPSWNRHARSQVHPEWRGAECCVCVWRAVWCAMHSNMLFALATSAACSVLLLCAPLRSSDDRHHALTNESAAAVGQACGHKKTPEVDCKESVLLNPDVELMPHCNLTLKILILTPLLAFCQLPGPEPEPEPGPKPAPQPVLEPEPDPVPVPVPVPVPLRISKVYLPTIWPIATGLTAYVHSRLRANLQNSGWSCPTLITVTY